MNAGFAGKLIEVNGGWQWDLATSFLGGKSYMIMSRAKVTSLKGKKNLEKRRETTLLFLFHPWHPKKPMVFFPSNFFARPRTTLGTWTWKASTWRPSWRW